MQTLTKKPDILPVIEKEISPIVAQARDLEITDEESKEAATVILSTLNKRNDRITEEKEKITKPLNQALKVERARWKPVETILEEGISIIRTKLTRYQTEAARKAQEEAAKIASRVGEGRGHLSAERAVAKIAAIDAPSHTTETDQGAIRFKTVKKFEVMDMTLLPIEFHLADETGIRTAMRNGTELPGVRYFTEQVPDNIR